MRSIFALLVNIYDLAIKNEASEPEPKLQ